MTYDGVKTENNNGTRKNTRRYVIICNSDYVRVNGWLYNDSRAKPRLRMVLGMPRTILNLGFALESLYNHPFTLT